MSCDQWHDREKFTSPDRWRDPWKGSVLRETLGGTDQLRR